MGTVHLRATELKTLPLAKYNGPTSRTFQIFVIQNLREKKIVQKIEYQFRAKIGRLHLFVDLDCFVCMVNFQTSVLMP